MASDEGITRMHYRWRMTAWLVVVLVAGTLTACGGETESDALTDISLALDWYPWSNHTGIYLAETNGYFADEGLTVNVYVPSDPSTGIQLVGSGQDDFTISYQTDVLLARAEAIEVMSVAALVQHPLNSIMTLESSGIERPSQLKGKTIGAPGLPSDESLLATMLAADGISINDVEVVTVGYDLVLALLGKTVDANIGAYWVHEPILAELQGQPVNIMRIEEWDVPDYYELLLVTNESVIDDQPEVVEKQVRALTRGYADAAADPTAAVAELVTANPETNRELETQRMQLLAPLWTDDGSVAFGTQTEERWQSYADWLRQQGILTTDVPIEQAFTNDFVQRAGQ